jgi:hypothetical protein
MVNNDIAESFGIIRHNILILIADGSMDSFCFIAMDRIRVRYQTTVAAHRAMHQCLSYSKSNI